MCLFFLMILRPPRSTRTDTLFPYTTLFRSSAFGRYFLIQTALPLRARVLGLLFYHVNGATIRRDHGTHRRLLRAGISSLRWHDIHGSAIWHGDRSEERRVGKECVSTCRSRWSPYH